MPVCLRSQPSCHASLKFADYSNLLNGDILKMSNLKLSQPGVLQKAQIEWAHKCQQRIDFINNQLRLERKAENKFTELNDAMREYHEVFGHELPPLP